MRAVQIVVSGRVQGVGFRWNCRRAAQERGVAGWVQNCDDGTVEAELIGADSAVESMLTWCTSGPPHADVTNVSVTELEVDEDGENTGGFEIR